MPPPEQDVLELVDAGNARSTAADQCRIDPGRCTRQGCKQTPVAGHGFCVDCLAWLRGDEDEDPQPVAAPSPPGPAECKPPPGADADEWYAALDAAIATSR